MPTATEPAHRQQELNSLSVFTVIVVLATVTMTFGALITVFVMRSQSQQFWGHIHVPRILWGTTALLLASSATFEAARRRLTANDQRAFFRLVAWTTALGFLFLIGQTVAWFQILHTGIVLARNPHSWFVFLFTGLHGLHIVARLGRAVLLALPHEGTRQRTEVPHAHASRYDGRRRVLALPRFYVAVVVRPATVLASLSFPASSRSIF